MRWGGGAGGRVLEGRVKRGHRRDADGFPFPLKVSSARCPSTGPRPQTRELHGARSARLLWDGLWTFQGFPCSPGRVHVKTANSLQLQCGAPSPGTVRGVDLEQHPEFSRVSPVSRPPPHRCGANKPQSSSPSFSILRPVRRVGGDGLSGSCPRVLQVLLPPSPQDRCVGNSPGAIPQCSHCVPCPRG